MTSKGSVEIKLVLKQQQQILSAYKKVEQQLKKNNEKIEDGFKKVERQSSKTQKGLSGLTSTFSKMIPAIVGVGAAMAGAKKAFDYSKEFAKFEQSSKAMEMQFGHSSDTVILKLNEVSKGTISSASLVSAANRAMALNVTSDLDEMAKLLEIARVRGHAMGLDTTQAFNDLVTGIGRGSPLILDNLGIITKGWDEEAKAAGRAMDAQFVLDKVLADGAKMLEKTGDVALTNAERFQQMEAKSEDLRLEIGEGLLPVVLDVQKGILKLVEALTSYSRKVEEFQKAGQLTSEKDLNSAINLTLQYLSLFKQQPNVRRMNMTQIKELNRIKSEYSEINQLARLYPIEEGENTLTNLNRQLSALIRIKDTRKDVVKSSLEEPKKNKKSIGVLFDLPTDADTGSFEQLTQDELKRKTELAYQIRELELQAQQETMQQQIDLVELRYEKERDLILNENASNTELLKALKENENKEIFEIEQRYRDSKERQEKIQSDRSKRRSDQDKRERSAALSDAVDNLRIFASENKKYGALYKTAAIARTVISTYEGAQNAFTSFSSLGPYGVALGVAAAAAAVAAGFARVQQIQSQKFASGGVVPGTGNQDTVPALLTPGEIVLNREQQQRLLDGDIGGTRIENVSIVVNGSNSPRETAATIEEMIYSVTEDSQRLRDVNV